jgi:ubiquinone/menaquinone biosynthesis C-methylase UbiE
MSNAERRAELQAQRAAELAERLREVLPTNGDERVLDVGAGTGAFSFAIASRVAQVVAVELDEELAAHARENAPENVEVVVGDGEHLSFDEFSFDLSATLRMLHHTRRPELVIAGLARVTKPGGRILVVDQIAPSDPLAAFEVTRFERARDPSTTRLLADTDLRGLFDANGLVLQRSLISREQRNVEAYLDLAGCEGAERERALALAPSGYEAVVGWYLLGR